MMKLVLPRPFKKASSLNAKKTKRANSFLFLSKVKKINYFKTYFIFKLTIVYKWKNFSSNRKIIYFQLIIKLNSHNILSH